MNRRQFLILFLCNLIPWWVGSGLVSLLPLYAASLGASPTVVGNFLSLLFLALAAGTMAGGWYAPKVRNFRQLLMVLGASSGVAILLMGFVTSIWQLILLSMVGWFSSGITGSLVITLASEQAETGARGRTFGLLAVATSLGGLLGGVSGFIVDHWGYPWLFVLAGATWFVQLLVATFLINPPRMNGQEAIARPNQAQSRELSASFAIPFLLLMVGALLVSIANFTGFLGRTLAMEANGFSNATIALVTALGSGLGLVINPLLGHLSDRGRRRLILGVLYVAGALALSISAYSRTVTNFVLVGILLAFSGAERGISVALVGDYVPANALSRSLSLFDGVKWLGGVVGLAGTGYAIEQMGLAQALLLSTLLPVVATLLLLFLRSGTVHPGHLPAPPLDTGWQVQQEGTEAQSAG
ncbi:MAG: MFS transporter [Caldilineaceae bacterium]|nr:MFS transporter [Caldilineaceae bacterium]